MTTNVADLAGLSIVESAVVSYLAGYRGETVRATRGTCVRGLSDMRPRVEPLAVTRAQIGTYARTLQGRSWSAAGHRRAPGNHGLLLLPALRC